MSATTTHAYERYLHQRCETFWNLHPFSQKLDQGTLSQEAIAYYLAAIGILCQDTPNHLSSVSALARREGLIPLADFFAKKIGEEANHDQWAENDMRTLGKAPLASHPAAHSRGLKDLIYWINDLSKHDILGYLGYLYAAEAITAAIGPRFVNTAEAKANLPSNQTSIISNHIELDAKHSEEGSDWIQYYIVETGRKDADQRIILSIETAFGMLGSIWLNAISYAEQQENRAIHHEHLATS